MAAGRSRASGPTLTRVAGVRVGHAEDPSGGSGVTAILFDRPAPTAVDVRGGASCTYDIASLDLSATFGRRWALFFSGGSLFGLDAARGVRTFLLSQGFGHTAFGNPNPVLPISGACLFDLPGRRGPLPDYLPLGFEAASRARSGPVVEGAVGAGAGARVGKYRGRGRSMPGGVGTAAVPLDRRSWVGALVVLNAVGAVVDPANGRWVAGAVGPRGRIVPPDLNAVRGLRAPAAGRGTTLVSIVTDAAVDRRTLHRAAVAGQAAVARSVVPVHTATDGDVVFASTTREGPSPPREAYAGAAADRLGGAAAVAVGRAVLRAARRGTGKSLGA